MLQLSDRMVSVLLREFVRVFDVEIYPRSVVLSSFELSFYLINCGLCQLDS